MTADPALTPAPDGPTGNGHDGERRRFHCTDLGNAERLVARHGADLRHCHPWNRALVWDGRRWRIDDTAVVARMAKATVRSIYAEAEHGHDADERERIAKWAVRSEAAARIRSMVELATSQPGIPALPADLDRDPWLLTVANGTLDLRTGSLAEHRRSDLITKIAEVAYEPDAPAGRWQRFLEEVTAGDAELAGYLQRMAGAALAGVIRDHVLHVLHGSGANGKSVFCETLAGLLGDYAQTCPIDTLLARSGERIPNDLARMRGVRLVLASESDEGRRLAEGLVKQLTGGDTVVARFLHAEWFEFRPTWSLWLRTNHRPVVRGSDEGIWRRLRLVPFTVSIPADAQDQDLVDKLRAEWPGVLAWAVRGCLDWQARGLGEPAAVTAATAGYRAEQDTLGEFLEACCVQGAGAYAYASELHEAFANFGGDKVSQKRFGQMLRERGFDRVRMGDARRWAWLGVGMAADGDQ